MGRMVHYGKCGVLWDMEDDACWDMMWPRDSPAATSIVAFIMLASRPFTRIPCWFTC